MPVIAHRKPYNAAQRASHTQCRRGSRDAELMHLVLQPCGTHLQLGEHAPKRPALPDPPHPQVALQIREPQLGQAGLPLGRPQRSLPRDRSARPDGCPAAWQPMLVEPVTHRGGVHAKLAGDAGGWPSPDHPPVGQVVLQWWEAQLRRPGGELLVGGGAPGVGGGHPAGRRGDARLVEQVADDLGGGGGRSSGGATAGCPPGRPAGGRPWWWWWWWWWQAHWPAARDWPAAGPARGGSWQGRCTPARERDGTGGAGRCRGP